MLQDKKRLEVQPNYHRITRLKKLHMSDIKYYKRLYLKINLFTNVFL